MNIKITIRPDNIGKKISSVNLKSDMIKAVAIITKRLEAGGKQKATEMIYQQPVSKSGYQRTGWLRNSITSSSAGFRGQVDALANYSLYVHEGTRFMKARPFFTEAVRDLQTELERETGKIIEVGIEKQLK